MQAALQRRILAHASGRRLGPLRFSHQGEGSLTRGTIGRRHTGPRCCAVLLRRACCTECRELRDAVGAASFVRQARPRDCTECAQTAARPNMLGRRAQVWPWEDASLGELDMALRRMRSARVLLSPPLLAQEPAWIPRGAGGLSCSRWESVHPRPHLRAFATGPHAEPGPASR